MTELLSTEHMFIADPSVFTVEKLLRKRKRHGSFEYLVKWRDYNFRFNTWEPESNILDQRLLDEFEERCKNGGDLFLKDDVYDTEMSDTENVERIANRRSAPVARTAAKSAKKKRTTRSSTFKLRGRREKRAPVGKYEELENDVEEKLTDDEDKELMEEVEDENKEGKEDVDFTLEEGEEKVEEVACVSDNEASASPVRSLRNKKITKPLSIAPAKKRTPSSKFSSLMKRSRKQAKTYGMQFSRKDSIASTTTILPPLASPAKLSSEDGEDQVPSDEAGGAIKITKTKEPNKQKRKRAAEDTVKLVKERQKTGSEEGEEEVSMKRKRPSRSCTVPTGFWDPVVKTGDSGIDSHSDNEDQIGTFKEEEIIRAQRRMKNFEPAPSNHETCYTETPAESSNGNCINDLGESVFPKKKFCLRPPTLDLSKRPLSDFVFKIDDLWADKIHVSSVKALGYSVKIFECKSAEALFTKKSSKLKRKESTRGQLGT